MSGVRRKLIASVQNKRFTTISDYTRLPLLDGEALPRDGVIVIRPEATLEGSECFVVELSGKAFGRAHTDPPLVAVIALDKTGLMPYVELCRRKWNDFVETRETRSWFGISRTEQPFIERATQKKELPKAAAKQLAKAGNDLFNAIFLRDDPQLPEWTRHFIAGINSGPCVLSVYSDAFFVPWGMLYVHPPGHGSLDDPTVECEKTGFLGYSHVIEHATDSFVPIAAIKPNGEVVEFGFTFDAGLDEEQGLKSIEQQRGHFKKMKSLRTCERASKMELEAAFKKSPFPDHISYFFLHGRTSDVGSAGVPPRFFIGRESIEAAEIEAWLAGRKLGSQPLLFFNACQIAQMRSLFYESFALRLLDLEARALIGPQIDIPTRFAEEYARRLFSELLKRKDGKDPRLGQIVRTLTQEFWNTDHNPLGLTYSLFKGADCYISW